MSMPIVIYKYLNYFLYYFIQSTLNTKTTDGKCQKCSSLLIITINIEFYVCLLNN